MTTTMLLFVIASLLASDPIISAPGAECMAMEAADGDNHAGPGRTWSPGKNIIQMQVGAAAGHGPRLPRRQQAHRPARSLPT